VRDTRLSIAELSFNGAATMGFMNYLIPDKDKSIKVWHSPCRGYLQS
jgi:hypothetical protein